MANEKVEGLDMENYPVGKMGPSQTEIDELKKTHNKVKACFIGNEVYLVRMMHREEYMAFQEEVNDQVNAGNVNFDVDSVIAERNTVWPEKVEWAVAPGGVATILATEVTKFSGFVPDKESVEL